MKLLEFLEFQKHNRSSMKFSIFLIWERQTFENVQQICNKCKRSEFRFKNGLKSDSYGCTLFCRTEKTLHDKKKHKKLNTSKYLPYMVEVVNLVE